MKKIQKIAKSLATRRTIYTLSFLALIGFLSSFVGVGTTDATMGKIQFIGDAGQATTFTIEQWKFTKMDVKKDKIEDLHVELEMDMSSMTASWKELLESVKKKKDYFYIKNFPKATVIIDKATKVKDNEYTCTAKLTLKNVTKPVELAFTVSPDSANTSNLKIKGSGIVVRQNFDFTGGGPKNEVPMMFDLVVSENK